MKYTSEIKNKGEREFAEFLDNSKLQYIHQPTVQVLQAIRYTPDFYVLQNNSFYEVVGSRQAFNQNRPKVITAQSLVSLFIVKPNGRPYNYQRIRKTNSSTRNNFTLKRLPFDFTAFLVAHKISPKQLARDMGITIYALNYNYKKGTMLTKYLDKLLEKYSDVYGFIQTTIPEPIELPAPEIKEENKTLLKPVEKLRHYYQQQKTATN